MVLVVKNLPANAGDIKVVGSLPGPGRSPGEGNSNALQYSYLEYPMDRGAWQGQSIELQKIGHKWSNLACMHCYCTELCIMNLIFAYSCLMNINLYENMET